LPIDLTCSLPEKLTKDKEEKTHKKANFFQKSSKTKILSFYVENLANQYRVEFKGSVF